MTTERIERIKRAEVNGAPPVPIGPMYDGVVYPSGDGEPMAENAYQYKAISYTESALAIWFQDDPAVYVAADMLIYYRQGDNGARLAPDVFVVAGAKGNHLRHSWLVWAEGGVPQFVLEVASPSTWERDAADKRDAYRDMGVLEYWRFDPESGKFLREILIGERLVNGEYVRMEVRRDADGTLRGYSDFLKLDVCVRPDGQIRLYDPAAGEWLLSPDESNAALSQRDAQLSETNAALRQRDAQLSESNAALRQRDAQLSESNAALRESNAEIERLRAALRERK